MRKRRGYLVRLEGTEWYYTPSRTINATYDKKRTKSNLSKTGKIYSHYPNIGLCAGITNIHVDDILFHNIKTSTHGRFSGQLYILTLPSDWRVEEI